MSTTIGARIADDHAPAAAERRALVVETEPVALRACREALEGLGYSVQSTESGVEALVEARRKRPDLIVIALQLRDVTGREAIAWIRTNQELRATPMIVLANDAGDEKDLAEFRPNRILRKPLTAVALRRAVDEIVG